MFGYDGWKTASPYDNDSEWTEKFDAACEEELDYAPEGHVCNGSCSPEDGYHVCGWGDEIEVTCVGGRDYTRYWTCGGCGAEHENEVQD